MEQYQEGNLNCLQLYKLVIIPVNILAVLPFNLFPYIYQNTLK